MTVFVLPDLGEGLEEAEIVHWHVGVGDVVTADQPLVSVETEKAVVEIPAPWSGRVTKLFGAVHDTARVGAPLVDIETEAAGARDSGAIVGSLEPQADRPVVPPAPPSPTPADRSVRAVPAVRALAARLGVDLARVAGTGPQGTITSGDIEAAAELKSPLQGWEPLHGVRRTMARNMARAGAEIVPATVHDDADIEDWTMPDPVLTRLVRALVAGALAEPAVNAWYDSGRNARRLHKDVDIGIAVDTVDGLVVPVLRGANRRDRPGLDADISQLIAQAKARQAGPAVFRDPTITLSNFGTIAGRHASLVFLPPQVAILGAGRIGPCVVARDGRPTVRRRLPLSLTFDHRVVTGGEAARFLAAVIRDLELAA